MTPLQQSALRLPQQNLEQCSLFACEVDAVQAWADDLPLGNPGRAGSLLRSALSELNRVALAPPLRFQLLEILRAPARSVTKSLERVCLNQPIVLDEEAQLRADIIADLCALSSAGYTLVAVHTIRGSGDLAGINPAKLAGESLHRAMVAAAQRIRLAYLLYQPIELNIWANLHQLYGLAERQQLARLPVDDELRDVRSTIAQEYVPPLLLASSKPNQLRQHDIMGAFRAFREWCKFVDLQDPEVGEGLFAVDMLSDQPPVFAELLQRRGSTQFRYLNTGALVAHLEGLRRSSGSQGLRVIEFDRETRIDTNLLEHLIKALGEISQRNFARQTSRTELHIASGLSNVHYFVAGGKTLDEVFEGTEREAATGAHSGGNPFLKGSPHNDQWERSNPEEDRDEHSHEESALPVELDRLTRLSLEQDREARDPVRYLVHSVKTMNASAGGYCVEWAEPPDSIHIGDIVCVREADNEQADWTIAVIRWVSQIKHAPTLLGLELVSPRGNAYAARIKMPSGEYSRPIRVLLLPEIPLVGQSHTLVVPRLVFKEGQRITLSREEDAFLVKLKRQVASTGYFSQMDFDYLRQLDEDIASSRRDALPTAAFDSIWSEI
ncbi:MAG: GTPase [Halieaceae bacterium]|jgi:hypothetical protein|nr:GTPase [Halieaceae bacterium]